MSNSSYRGSTVAHNDNYLSTQAGPGNGGAIPLEGRVSNNTTNRRSTNSGSYKLIYSQSPYSSNRTY